MYRTCDKSTVLSFVVSSKLGVAAHLGALHRRDIHLDICPVLHYRTG